MDIGIVQQGIEHQQASQTYGIGWSSSRSYSWGSGRV